jgi:hypothetical protein
MLRGVNQVVLEPETLDPCNDNADPYFAASFDKSERSYVVYGNVLRYFGEWSKLPPFPGRKTLLMFPKNQEMVVKQS